MSARISISLAVLAGALLVAPGAQASWIQDGQDFDGEAADDWCGSSVALSSDGSRVAIGAPYNDGNGSESGQVRVYEWSGSAWVQVGADIDGEAAHDRSGTSVALSSAGSRVAIGAIYSAGNGISSGQVRVYEWSGSAWVQLGTDIDGEAATDLSGTSVALSSDGSRVAIGAPYNSGNGIQSGHVRVYEWDGSKWAQLGGDLDGEAIYNHSGRSVALSSEGDRVAIGAPQNSGGADWSGHVRVYEWSGSAWSQVGADIDGEAAGDESGTSVALSTDGSRVAIGAPFNGGNGSDSGQVRVYEWSGSAWSQVGADIDGEATGDWSGGSVALSSAGSRVAIGALCNSGNGSDSGQVRVYEWTGSTWVQLGADIDGEAVYDESGYCIALSGEGDRVAIGAPFNDGNGFRSGHARVYGTVTIALTMPGTVFGSGDACSLTLETGNPGSQRDVDLYVLLDVDGSYWCYPSWQPLDVGLDYAEVGIPNGDSSLTLIPEFTMPAVSPYGPLYFYAAMFEPGTLSLDTLVSNGAVYQFSLGE